MVSVAKLHSILLSGETERERSEQTLTHVLPIATLSLFPMPLISSFLFSMLCTSILLHILSSPFALSCPPLAPFPPHIGRFSRRARHLQHALWRIQPRPSTTSTRFTRSGGSE